MEKFFITFAIVGAIATTIWAFYGLGPIVSQMRKMRKK